MEGASSEKRRELPIVNEWAGDGIGALPPQAKKLAGDRIELSTPGFSGKYSTTAAYILNLLIYRIVLIVLIIDIFSVF